jgi:anti-sigma B factor antagonist
MADETTFTFRTERTGEAAVVHCSGRLISTTAGQLHAGVKPLVTRGAKVVLDLTDVTFMDSMGLGTIASLYVSSKANGCTFELINLSRRVRDLFTVAHLLSLFEPCGESNAIIP